MHIIMLIPGAVIFINSDVSQQMIDRLLIQLRADESITHAEFVARVEAEPSYHDILVNTNQRLIVILNDFRNINLREEADIVLFLAHGLVNVEKNKYGPPGKSFLLTSLHIQELFEAIKDTGCYVGGKPLTKRYYIDKCGNIYNGIYPDEALDDPSGINLPNPDNIYNNDSFLKRKS